MLADCNSQGFEVELGTKEPVLVDKWLIHNDDTYSSYEVFLTAYKECIKFVQDWYNPEQTFYPVR